MNTSNSIKKYMRNGIPVYYICRKCRSKNVESFMPELSQSFIKDNELYQCNDCGWVTNRPNFDIATAGIYPIKNDDFEKYKLVVDWLSISDLAHVMYLKPGQIN